MFSAANKYTRKQNLEADLSSLSAAAQNCRYEHSTFSLCAPSSSVHRLWTCVQWLLPYDCKMAVQWLLPYDCKMAATAPGFTSAFQTQEWQRSYPPEALYFCSRSTVLVGRFPVISCRAEVSQTYDHL